MRYQIRPCGDREERNRARKVARTSSKNLSLISKIKLLIKLHKAIISFSLVNSVLRASGKTQFLGIIVVHSYVYVKNDNSSKIE